MAQTKQTDSQLILVGTRITLEQRDEFERLAKRDDRSMAYRLKQLIERDLEKAA